MRRDRSRRDDARQVRASCSPSPHSAPDRFLPRDLAHVVPGSPRLLLPSLDAARPPRAGKSVLQLDPADAYGGGAFGALAESPGGVGWDVPSSADLERRAATRDGRASDFSDADEDGETAIFFPALGAPVDARARRRDELLLPGDAERLEPPAVLPGPLGARVWRWARARSWTSWCARARTRTSSSRRWTRRLFFRATRVEPPGSARSPRPARMCSATKPWASQRNARSCAC